MTSTLLKADEGMWPVHALPIEQIKDRYEVTLTPAWIEQVQKACVRISSGGSGSFVSKHGLLLTNHHVGESAIYNLSNEEQDLIKNGFLAKNRKQELKCPNLYVDRLVMVKDITEEVNSQITTENPQEKEKLRKQLFATIKQREEKKTGLQPEVVLLYRGAQIYLYLYERFTDIRLVMAPEKEIAFFGGDIENFEYPRANFDFCFFRVYKNNKPLKSDPFLRWSCEGPQPGELLCVAGHPGSTSRGLTSSHLRFFTEYGLANRKRWLTERKEHLAAFSQKGSEQRRIALHDLGSLENTLKVLNSFSDQRMNALITAKKEQESSDDPAALAKLNAALDSAKDYWKSLLLLEGSPTSKLYSWARHLVRMVDELPKPNEERLQEYSDSDIKTVLLHLFSEEPLYPTLEAVELEDFFHRVVNELAEDHPLKARLTDVDVTALIEKTRVKELAFRKQLYEHPEQIKDSDDPLIALVKTIDPYARELRKRKEAEFDAVQNETYTKLVHDEFVKRGTSLYPDATFTLRLSFGTMIGYEEEENSIAPITKMDFLYREAERHQFKEPYSLPDLWIKKKTKLSASTPVNFVSTNDLVGGNSGSPVLNSHGELVGLIFDGNRYSNLWYFSYEQQQGRAISVHSAGILEVLKTVYKAKSLIRELLHDAPSKERLRSENT